MSMPEPYPVPTAATAPADLDVAERRKWQGLQWTLTANWDGDEYIGPGLPPWGHKTRCTGRAKVGTDPTGERRRCRKAAIPGGHVCPTHGGAAPQVKAKAKLRLISLIEPMITVLAREAATADKSADRQRAANSLLDRAGMGRAIGDFDSNAAKALLMERHAALRERLEEERAAAGYEPAEADELIIEAETVEPFAYPQPHQTTELAAVPREPVEPREDHP